MRAARTSDFGDRITHFPRPHPRRTTRGGIGGEAYHRLVTRDGSADAPGGQLVTRPRVLLAEDSPEMAAELNSLLRADFDVALIVRDGPTLVAQAAVLRPDVVVTDIGMPGMSGLAAAVAILTRHPSTPIVFVTVHCERAWIERAFAIGAMGYVVKRDAGDELVEATRHALRGLQYLSVSARKLLHPSPRP